MKEASGEASMTFITIAAIALIAGFLAWLWPVIRDKIGEKWDAVNEPTPTAPNGIYFPYNIEK